MLMANEVLWLGALVVLVLGVFVTLARLRAGAAKQMHIKKNLPVKVVTYRNGKSYKFAFSTIRDAAAYALDRLATGEGVAYIEANGITVWNSLKGRQSLVELAK
jgi:hypothetical protein